MPLLLTWDKCSEKIELENLFIYQIYEKKIILNINNFIQKCLMEKKIKGRIIET